jgi:anaerobic dimethyl sulfoxide reductase subunit B (iron-sulfur subunit)
VDTKEEGRFPDLFVSFMIRCCYHCDEPECVEACPVQAIQKRKEDGVVLVDRESCIGKDNCNLCLDACLYGAPQFGDEENAKMQKCEFCIDRLAEGKNPICVDSCPMRALDAGPIDVLKARYGDITEAEGFVHSSKLRPSIIFKPKAKVSLIHG